MKSPTKRTRTSKQSLYMAAQTKKSDATSQSCKTMFVVHLIDPEAGYPRVYGAGPTFFKAMMEANEILREYLERRPQYRKEGWIFFVDVTQDWRNYSFWNARQLIMKKSTRLLYWPYDLPN